MKLSLIMTLKLVVLALAITVIVSVPMAGGTEKQVSLCTLEWPPYAGKRLRDYGISSRIITEAFKRSGHAVTITFRPWNRLLYEVRHGRYDAFYFFTASMNL